MSSLIPLPDWAFPIWLGMAGAIAGSFLATIVIRWPQGRRVTSGRSACDCCGKTLRAGALVPLISALALGGRCHDCGARIDARHWQIELGCAAIGALSGYVAPGMAGAAGAMFGWLLLTLAALDAANLWLPDALTLPLAAVGLCAGASGVAPGLEDRVIGGIVGFGSLWVIARAYRLIRKREGLGGGDAKLFGAIGLWLGWRLLPAILLFAAMIGLGLALFDYARGHVIAADTKVPFGAFLAIAAYPAWLMMISLGA
ncbi:prepilin peptidase [Sphingomonas sp. TX0543]|uniref:prepilin peptidase n=1 Tax=unclassified Sphingomonas TaxID=196159 RepID=UPI001484D22E|nr:A24 family peptidase [Sphingomonas sp. 3P27F8]